MTTNKWWMRFDEGRNPTATIAEHEWLSTTTDREIFHVPNPPFRLEFLLYHLRQSMRIDKTRWGKRKLRLFACGCCRRSWNQLSAACRSAVEFAEQFADGKATKQERWDYWQRIVDPPNGRRFARSDFGQYVLETSDWCAAILVPRVSDAVFCGTLRSPEEWGDEAFQMAGIVHDIFGNPFRPVTADAAWRTPNAFALAQTIYDERTFDHLPILADVLEEAGCHDATILDHCRQPGEHVRGCWVLDSILNRRWRGSA